MPEPTISLRDLKKAHPVNGQAYVCVTVPERDALVEAVEAAAVLVTHPFGRLPEREFYRLREKTARFSDGATDPAEPDPSPSPTGATTTPTEGKVT